MSAILVAAVVIGQSSAVFTTDRGIGAAAMDWAPQFASPGKLDESSVRAVLPEPSELDADEREVLAQMRVDPPVDEAKAIQIAMGELGKSGHDRRVWRVTSARFEGAHFSADRPNSQPRRAEWYIALNRFEQGFPSDGDRAFAAVDAFSGDVRFSVDTSERLPATGAFISSEQAVRTANAAFAKWGKGYLKANRVILPSQPLPGIAWMRLSGNGGLSRLAYAFNYMIYGRDREHPSRAEHQLECGTGVIVDAVTNEVWTCSIVTGGRGGGQSYTHPRFGLAARLLGKKETYPIGRALAACNPWKGTPPVIKERKLVAGLEIGLAPDGVFAWREFGTSAWGYGKLSPSEAQSFAKYVEGLPLTHRRG